MSILSSIFFSRWTIDNRNKKILIDTINLNLRWKRIFFSKYFFDRLFASLSAGVPLTISTRSFSRGVDRTLDSRLIYFNKWVSACCAREHTSVSRLFKRKGRTRVASTRDAAEFRRRSGSFSRERAHYLHKAPIYLLESISRIRDTLSHCRRNLVWYPQTQK